MRLVLIAMLLLADLFVLPAVSQIPSYVTPSKQHWSLWWEDWSSKPVESIGTVMKEPQVRMEWLALQPLLGAAMILLLLPRGKAPGSKGKPERDPSGAHGNARWRTARELSDTLDPYRIGRVPVEPGILAGTDRQKKPRKAWVIPGPSSKARTNPHVLVLGGSGAGKTRRLVLPNLYLLGQAKAAGKPNSIVITDPKGELYSFTAEHFRRLGYRVQTLNLIEPSRSSRYNPIAEISQTLKRGDRTAAAEAVWDLAHAFASMDDDKGGHREDPFWQNAAESIIAATAYYVAAKAPEDQRTMATVYRLLTEYGKDGGGLLDLVFRKIEDIADPGRIAYGVTQLSVEKTRSSILTTAAVNLRLFADPTVTAMTAGYDYQLSSLGKEPTVVYLMLPDDKSSRNAVAAIYLTQAYSALSHLAMQSPGGCLPVPVYWILDEFANIGKFKDFDKMISVMRGRGMSAMIVLQALQQLEARYGRETAAVITANCDTWLFLRTNDRETARELSEKLGQYTVRSTLTNLSVRPYETTSGSSEQLSGRPLLTPDEILRWKMGKVLILQAGQYPAELSLTDISEWPAKFALGGPPPVRIDLSPTEPWLPFGKELSQSTGLR